jgi:hypothetical protein
MRRLRRVATVMAPLIPIALVAMATAPDAIAGPCENLPRSDLKISRFEANTLTEQEAPRAELDRLSGESPVIAAYRAPHPLMVLVRPVRSGFKIKHRSVASTEDGIAQYCDAPVSVEIGLGFVKRILYLVPEAARDACVRQTLLEHEERHETAETAALKSFLAEEADAFTEKLSQLKRRPSPSAKEAEASFERGMTEALAEMERRFLAVRDRTREDVDNPEEIERLRSACDGRLQRLEQGPV